MLKKLIKFQHCYQTNRYNNNKENLDKKYECNFITQICRDEDIGIQNDEVLQREEKKNNKEVLETKKHISSFPFF